MALNSQGSAVSHGVFATLHSIFRQSQNESRPLIDLAGNSGFSPMRLDNRFDQAQTEAETPLRTALVPAIKPGPNFVLLFKRNTDARIAEHGDGFVRFALNGDIHTT